MGEHIRTLSLALIAIGLIVVLAVFGAWFSPKTSIANQFQKTVQTDIYLNRDDSSRSVRGAFYINQAEFEANVVDDMKAGKRTLTAIDTDNKDTKNDGINFTYAVKDPDGNKSVVSKIPDGYSVLSVKARSKINGGNRETNATITNGDATVNNDIANRDKDTN